MKWQRLNLLGLPGNVHMPQRKACHRKHDDAKDNAYNSFRRHLGFWILYRLGVEVVR